MRLNLFRIDHDADSTTGYLKVDGRFECFTLEDEKRLVKVPKETRIPSGTYKIALRKVESPKTLSYREKYPWFVWHLHLLDVPGFKYVYIHVGNTDDDTDGCILVGDGVVNQGSIEDFLSGSVSAFERLYKKVYPLLDKGRDVTLTIYD